MTLSTFMQTLGALTTHQGFRRNVDLVPTMLSANRFGPGHQAVPFGIPAILTNQGLSTIITCSASIYLALVKYLVAGMADCQVQKALH